MAGPLQPPPPPNGTTFLRFRTFYKLLNFCTKSTQWTYFVLGFQDTPTFRVSFITNKVTHFSTSNFPELKNSGRNWKRKENIKPYTQKYFLSQFHQKAINQVFGRILKEMEVRAALVRFQILVAGPSLTEQFGAQVSAQPASSWLTFTFILTTTIRECVINKKKYYWRTFPTLLYIRTV